MPDLIGVDAGYNSLGQRTYTAIVFKVGSTYYARKFDGTLISSSTSPEVPLQAALNLKGDVFVNAGVGGEPGVAGDNFDFSVSGTFSGLTMPGYTSLIIGKGCNMIVPSGYTGIFLNALNSQGYWSCHLYGSIREAAPQSRLWTCFNIESSSFSSPNTGSYIEGFGGAQINYAGTVVQLKTSSTGWCNLNIVENLYIDYSKIGIKFNNGGSGEISHNLFRNITMQGWAGGITTDFVKDVTNDTNTFLECYAVDFTSAMNGMNVLSTARGTRIIGGSLYQATFTDLGAGTVVLSGGVSQGSSSTKFQNRYNTTPDLTKHSTWYGTSNATEMDGFLNSRMSASTVGTGSKTNVSDSTGMYMLMDTGATINSIFGHRATFACMKRSLNAYFKTALYPSQTTASRIFAGFSDNTSVPTSSADPLVGFNGVALWFDSAVSANWKITYNDAAGGTSIDDTGVVLNANTLYPVEIYAVGDSEFRVVFNGVSTSITSNIPASTTNLGFQIYIENTAAASKTCRVYYEILKVDK